MRRRLQGLAVAAAVVAAALALSAMPSAQAPGDPIVDRIIELGTKDNKTLVWNDYASNRFGGRETGSNSYTDAALWAVWQLKQFGLDARLEKAGELPVGFNRGPWFGKMLKPTEKALRFGTPSFTAGTKGIQRGPVVILRADPFSIPGRAQAGRPVARENVEKKRAAVQAALAEVAAKKAAFKGAWVLIAGASSGFARDGRRGSKLPDGSPEYLDAEMMPPLTKALIDAGALGTIQSATPPSPLQPHQNSEPPINILDGFVASWDALPVLPDIKLLDAQYKEIEALVEKGEPVVLEFDIRNHFKMGPIEYHNVVATLPGTAYPDEHIVIGGHFDAFSSGTGGVDDGSGFAPGMEAIRLIAAAGAKPKRSITFIGFAAEEQGLVGSQAWLKQHPELHPKIVMMINRDGSPSAITGATVPETWYEDFKAITAPLASLNPRWPFVLARGVPRAHATSPGGTDSSSFEMVGVPTLNFATSSARIGPDGKEIPSYPYSYAWHTTNDLYSELVPYAEHQQHSALVTAVVAYGVANLEKPLTRAGVYLADGLYATLAIGSGEETRQIMTTLDYVNAPLATANFVRIVEGKAPAPAGRAGGPPPGMGFGGRGGRGGPEQKPIGQVLDVKDGLVSMQIVSDTQKSVAVARLPRTLNPKLGHDAAGVLGLSGPNVFYLTLQKKSSLNRRSAALGTVIAGLSHLQDLKKGDTIRAVRITRVGDGARDFKTDDEAFAKLLGAKK
ncbi:MAG TPA: M20/M25/M40 family metallo-hydrolase [Vicinamibacterales bacterium]|nr:M20/M25/M40 family metallo-hydrolase [Vicinamibacterales bacterium]